MASDYDLFSSFQDAPGSVLFVDTETTGADTSQDHIVEVAFLLAEYRGTTPLGSIDEFSSLVKPPVPVPPEASAVHHITNVMLTDAPSAADLNETVKGLSERAAFICAHNLPFDMAMLQRGFPGVFSAFNEDRRIDTLRLSRHCFSDIPSHGLQALRYRHGLDSAILPGDAHRALFDTRLVKALLDSILEQNLTGATGLSGLVEFIARPLEIKVFNFGKHKGCLVEDTAATDPDYIRWLLKQEWLPLEYPDLYHTLLKKTGQNGSHAT
ncbi:MAG: exonuclease domain-containing protein [Candidatus Fermentibacteraceae bacterium]